MTATRPNRRFFRYSLRTLMIVVTVFCVWMGMTAKRARDQRQAVDAILKVGGGVIYDYTRSYSPVDGRMIRTHTTPPGPLWLYNFIGFHFRVNAVGIVIEQRPVADTTLQRLEAFNKLEYVSFAWSDISDADLKYLENLTNLRGLRLDFTDVTSQGLEHIKGLTDLQFLSLLEIKVTDAGLEHLKGLTDLKSLHLWNAEVTDAGLEHLRGLTKLKILHVGSAQVTDEGVRKLQQALPNCKITGYPQPIFQRANPRERLDPQTH